MKRRGIKGIDLLTAVFFTALVVVFLIRATTPQPLPPLQQEIYQVRGQLEVDAKTIVLLRNGADKDVKTEILRPLPPDVFFVKPGMDKDGNPILVPVRPVTEEQRLERAKKK